MSSMVLLWNFSLSTNCLSSLLSIVDGTRKHLTTDIRADLSEYVIPTVQKLYEQYLEEFPTFHWR